MGTRKTQTIFGDSVEIRGKLIDGSGKPVAHTAVRVARACGPCVYWDLNENNKPINPAAVSDDAGVFRINLPQEFVQESPPAGVKAGGNLRTLATAKNREGRGLTIVLDNGTGGLRPLFLPTKKDYLFLIGKESVIDFGALKTNKFFDPPLCGSLRTTTETTMFESKPQSVRLGDTSKPRNIPSGQPLCPLCDGKGTVLDGATCQLCKGTGRKSQ